MRATFQEDGVWMRTCNSCREAKPLKTDFYKRKSDDLTFCNQYFYRCRDCEETRRQDPEIRRKNAERRKRDAEADPQKELERERRYRAKLKAEPKRHVEYLERRRISEYLRKEKAGMLSRKFQPAKMAKEENTLLPAKPLYLVAKKYIERSSGESETIQEACNRLGITDREYRRWVTEEQKKVRLETADKLLTAMGLHWWDVWDEDEVPERLAA